MVEAVRGVNMATADIQVGGGRAAVAKGSKKGDAVDHDSEDGAVRTGRAVQCGDAAGRGLAVVVVLQG